MIYQHHIHSLSMSLHSPFAHLVGAEPVGLDVVLHGEAVVKQEAVVALAPVAVVHLLWWWCGVVAVVEKIERGLRCEGDVVVVVVYKRTQHS